MRRTGERGSRQPRHGAACAVLLSLSLAQSCTGEVEPTLGPGSDAVVASVGTTPSAHASSGGAADAASGQRGALLGRTGPRRLSNVEYDNTARDLLGSKQTLATAFVYEEASGFDNFASALGMSPSQYESYELAAESLVSELFADAARLASVLPCNPSGDDGGACLEQLLTGLGTRTFRRQLSETDKALLRALHRAALDLGLTPPEARAQVLVAMLASPQFLYRLELDAPSGAPASRPLDGYELASRLSYFLWSTLPDATLLQLASSGELVRTDVLRAQLARMLADPRADSLVSNFAAQWLGLRELGQHKVDASKYPGFDDALRSSMIQEAKLFFGAFLRTPLPLTDFLSSPMHFVDGRLAAHYGLPDRPTGVQRVDTQLGDRHGFLGLAAFLTNTSFSTRTSPTLRAKWVLEELLCSPVPAPPPTVVAALEESQTANAASIDNVRARLELHRGTPACAGCHATLDPIGLGLEGFDAIGKSRTKYDNGELVDTHGVLPTGESFGSLTELSMILVKDARFPRCVAKQLLTYALGRSLEQDEDLLDATLELSGPATLSALIENIVMSAAFREQLPSPP